MKYDKEKFKEMFPALFKEIEDKTSSISIIGVRTEELEPEEIIDELTNPDVISFIRRCKTEEEALEIIDFCEKRGEITPQYAKKLRKQLKEKGLRSFGPYKPPGYYFKVAKLLTFPESEEEEEEGLEEEI
ncbi:MAG: DUF2095 family protein [Candidatus Odinarchaeota archaeon]|nr:DUF2095 family protein [Candidatus Odinarchaeota archaeon]